MRYLSADILFTANTPPKVDTVLVIDDDGLVLDITQRSNVDENRVEYFQGALCPGFVNTHCHIELSHLLAQMDKHKGLPFFINQIVKKRTSPKDVILDSIVKADNLMFQNGIVAVGDISNTSASFTIKDSSQIHYHTFIELFASAPEKAHSVFQNGLDLIEQCNHSCSLTPHSTYSVSNELFNLLKSANRGQLISIHNQETSSEDDLFLKGNGELFNKLKDKAAFVPTGQSALRSTLAYLTNAPLLLVHNTYTSESDIRWAMSNHTNLYWATCPKANRYIENTLPNYHSFISQNAKMTIGTDSLASNDTLSILEEMKLINSEVSLDHLIEWACKNGAEFLGLDQLGSIEIGKKPGINHISRLSKQQLTLESGVNRIV